MEDLYAGCFEGGVYLIPGRKDGGYAQPAPLLDKAGQILRLGGYWDHEQKKWTRVETSQFKEFLGIGAAAVDWDEDGDLDLIIGSNQGRIFLRMNEGSVQKPAFATESIALMVGTAPMMVSGRCTIPFVVDWDGDGLWDLLSGSGDGGVVWFRNIGKKGAPAFAAEQVLVQKNDGPGDRTLVSAADVDADGDLDLLVGDQAGAVWLIKRGR